MQSSAEPMLVITVVTLSLIGAGLVFLPEFEALASTIVVWFAQTLGIVP